LSSKQIDDLWNEFTFAYPNLTWHDPEASLNWDVLPMTKALFGEIMAGLSKWKRSNRWKNPRYIHDAKNFIAKNLWMVDPEPRISDEQTERRRTQAEIDEEVQRNRDDAARKCAR